MQCNSPPARTLLKTPSCTKDTMCCICKGIINSVAPEDGRIGPKHVELKETNICMKLVIDSYLLCYLLNISTYYLYTQRGWHISERPYSFTYLRRCTGMLKNPYPDQEGNKLMFLSKWREFPSTPCLAGKKNLMTARVSVLLKSRAV